LISSNLIHAKTLASNTYNIKKVHCNLIAIRIMSSLFYNLGMIKENYHSYLIR